MRISSTRSIRFPPGFLWGTATASHQVEGGNRWNDWWQLEQAGRLPYVSGDACRHYELFEQDFDLVKSSAQNAHRLSIEWSRIEPAEGHWNVDAINHYVSVVRALRQRGIEPLLTLHHFSNPQWFAERGGWHASGAVELFKRFVERVIPHLIGDVRLWLTINEPTVYVKRAYISGVWPPCAGRSIWKAVRALRNMLAAHRAAYAILHRARADVLVGFAHSTPWVVPCDAGRVLDRLAASARDFVLNRLPYRMLHWRRPSRVVDFVGVNYYTRSVTRWRPSGLAALVGAECREDHHGEPRSFNSLGWEIYPRGLRETLRRMARFGVPLIVTENGISTRDEQLRVRFLQQHISELALAVEEGLPILGYFYWTLYDNFEWTEGYESSFGLAAVDRLTQARSLRPAAEAYRRICADNSVNLESPTSVE